ncbi:MAG: glutamyl-tRNA amidotransferase, partial [Gemmatimonadetes bacterium]|nr:glutamyl-tRNA amidotransferase [Gemmatimonadota bacterium]
PSEWEPACPDFAEHPERQAYLADLVAALDDADVDALIYPSWLSQPAPLDRANEEYRGDNSQRVAPATGTPAVSVPMGFAASGLPAGLQLLGRPFADGLLLRLAYSYERATAHRRPPAGFPALAEGGG